MLGQKGGSIMAQVPSLPTRNGNCCTVVSHHENHPVPSLPTRNGNKPCWCRPLPLSVVPSLPTRNGNGVPVAERFSRFARFPAYLQGMETDFSLGLRRRRLCRSQPTYKEWKLRDTVYELRAETCSQPTYKEWKRKRGTLETSEGSRFPAYLQGMETSYVIENGTRLSMVPSLPTRNGNDTRTGRDHQ